MDAATRRTSGNTILQIPQFGLQLIFADRCRSGRSLYSPQQHDRLDADRHGVHTPDVKDFNDVAALASLMDIIVSVDTAALHVAGAIGHPTVFAILPWASTWRWQDPGAGIRI